MRINDLIRKSVLFLGILDDQGAFAPYGTGFIALYRPKAENFDRLIPFLVTADHVLKDMLRTKRPLVCRVNGKDGQAQLGRIEMEHWLHHPANDKCDVAVAPFAMSFESFDIRGIALFEAVLTPEYIKKNDIGEGDEVLTTGLLVSHFGKNKNVPIVRVGNIAAMAEGKVDLGDPLGEQEVYLVEGKSIGGLSGSPVFYHTSPIRVIDQNVKFMEGDFREYIMGVHIGLFETKANADSLRTATTIERRENFLDAMSSGIGVVVPIQRVIETIENNPELVKFTEETVKKWKERPALTLTSSAPKAERDGKADHRASDENPNAREDFTSLLSAAARKQQQDG